MKNEGCNPVLKRQKENESEQGCSEHIQEKVPKQVMKANVGHEWAQMQHKFTRINTLINTKKTDYTDEKVRDERNLKKI